MSDLKLFDISNNPIKALPGSEAPIERSLQTLMEKNLDTLLGVRFLASEHSTGPVHGGRIDTLGIDENNCPVIIEYKRATNENVINQGLFYLDWLMDHRADFELLVMKKLNADVAAAVEWSSPRLLCIAGGFTRYDEHAVKQINRNIELIRYQYFDNRLLALELVNATQSKAISPEAAAKTPLQYKYFSQYLAEAGELLRNLYEAADAFCQGLGDDVQVKTLKFYQAYRRIQNFVCLELKPQAQAVQLYLKVDPDTVELHKGFTRDVREIGHYGTGDLEVIIRSLDDLKRAEPLILRSYDAS
jgi:predicted transport protein